MRIICYDDRHPYNDWKWWRYWSLIIEGMPLINYQLSLIMILFIIWIAIPSHTSSWWTSFINVNSYTDHHHHYNEHWLWQCYWPLSQWWYWPLIDGMAIRWSSMMLASITLTTIGSDIGIGHWLRVWPVANYQLWLIMIMFIIISMAIPSHTGNR